VIPRRYVEILAAVAVAAAACGGTRQRPVEVSGRGAPAPRSLADDVAELRRAATRPGHFPQAVTILGWTADRRLAYRALVCAHDELGGRGDSCDLSVCAVAPAVGHAVVEPSCEAAAAFELYGEPDFDAARTTAAAEEAVARLGPLTPGHARSTGAVVVAIEDRTLRFTGAGQPPQVLTRPRHEVPVDPRIGVVDAEVAAARASPDGTCVGAVGLYGYRASYEGVYGRVVHAFGAVACAR
jgi:hypothetical protein